VLCARVLSSESLTFDPIDPDLLYILDGTAVRRLSVSEGKIATFAVLPEHVYSDIAIDPVESTILVVGPKRFVKIEQNGKGPHTTAHAPPLPIPSLLPLSIARALAPSLPLSDLLVCDRCLCCAVSELAGGSDSGALAGSVVPTSDVRCACDRRGRLLHTVPNAHHIRVLNPPLYHKTHRLCGAWVAAGTLTAAVDGDSKSAVFVDARGVAVDSSAGGGRVDMDVADIIYVTEHTQKAIRRITLNAAPAIPAFPTPPTPTTPTAHTPTGAAGWDSHSVLVQTDHYDAGTGDGATSTDAAGKDKDKGKDQEKAEKDKESCRGCEGSSCAVM
jgi:hypothetical protein